MTINWTGVAGCNCALCREARKDAVNTVEVTPEAKEVPTSRTLTREMVLKGRPCSDYRHKFIERFPVSVEVTLDLALSQIEDWDWSWAADHLLSRSAQREFFRRQGEADKAYAASTKPFSDLLNDAYTKYYEARSAALREAVGKGLNYAERYEYADKAAEGILTVPRAASNAAADAAGKIYNEMNVHAFVELFLSDAEAYAEEHKNDRPFVEVENDESDYDESYYDDYDEDTDY